MPPSAPSQSSLLRFGIVVFDGFDELDAVAPFEVLKGAAKFGAPFQVAWVSAHGAASVTAVHGLNIVVEPANLRDMDWIVVPGGGWADRGAQGTWAEIARGDLPRRLRDEHARGACLAAVCTGAMLLSAAGLTRGRPATTHHVARPALAAEGAHLIDARVVDDGDLVTCGGVTSGLDMALWLVDRLASPVIAERVQKNLEHTRTGTVHHGPGSRVLR